MHRLAILVCLLIFLSILCQGCVTRTTKRSVNQYEAQARESSKLDPVTTKRKWIWQKAFWRSSGSKAVPGAETKTIWIWQKDYWKY